jgi:hypothetical protein
MYWQFYLVILFYFIVSYWKLLLFYWQSLHCNILWILSVYLKYLTFNVFPNIIFFFQSSFCCCKIHLTLTVKALALSTRTVLCAAVLSSSELFITKWKHCSRSTDPHLHSLGQVLICFLISADLLSYCTHFIKIESLYLVLSLTLVFSRFIYVVAWINTSIFL